MAAPEARSEYLEREPGLLKPAGLVTLLGVALFAISVFIQASVGGGNIDTDLELITQYHDHGSTLLIGDIVGGLAFLCFGFTLYVLFKSAQARSTRVRKALIAFAFIGPVLLAIQGPVQTIALNDAADDYFSQPAAAASAPAAEDAASAPSKQGGSDTADAAATDSATTTSTSADTSTSSDDGAAAKDAKGEVTTTPTAEETSSTESTTTTSSDDDDEDSPEEQRANDLLDDSGLVQFSRALIFPGLLGLVFALVYIPMWSMRVGLITRFWGTLGMALGVSLLLLPFAQLAVVLWFAAMAVLLLDRWPGGRPPAWAAGVAIPWLKPGDEPPEGPPGTVEGQGREVLREGDDPVTGPAEIGSTGPGDGANGTDPSGPEPPEDPRRKRKRRR